MLLFLRDAAASTESLELASKHRASRMFAHAGMGARARRGGSRSRRVDGVRGGERQPETRAAADSNENPGRGGVYHSLALSSSGAVYAWGWNIVGQLGNGSTNGSDVPVKVRLPGGTKVTGISGGFAHSLAVTSSGAVFAWGKNYDGELGNGGTTRQRRAGEGEPARGHEGDRGRRRRRAQPGGDLDRRGARLGLEQRRPARQRQHGKQQVRR